MARVRQHGTGAEQMLREALKSWGVRFRVNVRSLPGSPDIYVNRAHRAIFVHGCFWHQHASCKAATVPKTRTEFWENKFRDNQRRDQRNARLLRMQGIGVSVVWECETKNPLKWLAVQRRIHRLLDLSHVTK